ncbi:accessory Sec system protein translocase subunit SecY2 [Lactobacillus corticis]|uniref:Accessory Sec system protein translocase subunit SecY2 n=1 Tax=Lactobacillus corticis TaxID=2201249 RepID=A0A916VHS0_9LACO|nr:accessory Sec system protein translocase subunit SecY2 [Lactobacillus corticis]GFZ26608.1 preprotein translocase subunit SecY [Lactobacillus corticis]
MRTWLAKHILIRRMAWSMLIIFIFMLGKAIPLPYLLQNSWHRTRVYTEFSIITGGDLGRLSIFSLGIGPWMAALIIFSFLGQTHKFEKVPQRTLNLYQRFTTLLIAVIQGFVTVMDLPLERQHLLRARLLNMCILVAGAFLIMWLCNMNAKLGLGDFYLLVMVNIVSATMRTILGPLMGTSRTNLNKLGLFLLILFFYLLFIVLNLLLDRGEVRLPIKRINMTEEYLGKSYLPIKLAPAGGLPVMFAMAVMNLPIYLFRFFAYFWSQSRVLQWLIANFSLKAGLGVSFYCLTLFALSFLFAYLNVDPTKQAEILQKSGDYIPGYEPGGATEELLRQKVFYFALLGGIYLTIVAGFPLFWGIGNPERLKLLLLPGYFLLISSFLLILVDQINTLLIGNYYQELFKRE